KMKGMRKGKNSPYEVGELVMLSQEAVGSGLSAKLAPKWKGPYEVIKVHSAVNVTIQHQENPADEQRVHIFRLKRFKKSQTSQREEKEEVSGEEKKEFEVERINKHRVEHDGTNSYHVHWKGYAKSADSWVTEADMGGSP